MDCLDFSLLNNQIDGTYLFDGEKNLVSDIFIGPNRFVTVVFINLINQRVINFDIKNDSHVKFLFLQKECASILIRGNINKDSELTVFFAEFSKRKFELNTDIKLIGENSKCFWNLASLSKNDDDKKIDVSIYHNNIKTESLINNYGVARDVSKLIFSGICKINNGSHESKAHQNAKIMVFDENSDAIVKPILKIDDNDIEASHAAVVGKISDDHLFYLCSRGLSLKEARELITLGYLKPILNGFDDEDQKKEITELIERGL